MKSPAPEDRVFTTEIKRRNHPCLSGKGYRGKRMNRHVLFVCVRNRVRSVFAEFYLQKMLKERLGPAADDISISSAGFYPKRLRDILDKANISPPEPFFDADMSPVARRMLEEKSIASPDGWRSRPLTPQHVLRADLIVVALQWQKEEISEQYPEIRDIIFTFRELAAWGDNILFETFSGLPMNDDFWYSCEEDPPYVAKVIDEVEKLMDLGFERILMHLGFEGSSQSVTTGSAGGL